MVVTSFICGLRWCLLFVTIVDAGLLLVFDVYGFVLFMIWSFGVLAGLPFVCYCVACFCGLLFGACCVIGCVGIVLLICSFGIVMICLRLLDLWLVCVGTLVAL